MKNVRVPGLALVLALSACGGGAPPAPQGPTATAAPAQEAPKTVKTVEGVLVTYRAGIEIGREQFHDDGDLLVSKLAFAGHEGTVTVTRAPRHVTVEAGGKRVESDVDDHTVVLENGAWQMLALAAAWFP